MRRSLAWVGVGLFFLVIAGAVSIGLDRGWLAAGARDDWTFDEFAAHLERKGVNVVVRQETHNSATFNDRAANGWVRVTRAGSREDARERARIDGRNWPSYTVVGAFVIVAVGPGPEDADLCRRIRNACRD